jgi:ribosomal protein L28
MDFETVPQPNLSWKPTKHDGSYGDVAVSAKELSLFDREGHISSVIVYDISHI